MVGRGLRLGLGYRPPVRGKLLPDITQVMYGGDSLANRIAAVPANVTEFTTTLDGFGLPDVDVYDGSQGGSKLARSLGDGTGVFWDDVAGLPFNKYQALWDTIPEKDDIEFIVLSFGTNDKTNIPDDLTGEEWEDAFVDMLNYMFTDFSSLRKVGIRPLGRHRGDSDQDPYDIVREAQHNLPGRVSNVFMMPEIYDQPIPSDDNVHPSDAAHLVIAERDARRIAYLEGKNTDPTLGMLITKARVVNDGIKCTIEHSDGTNLTVPSSGGGETFGVLIDSTRVDVTGITKNNATSITLNTSPVSGDTKELTTVYGSLLGIDDEAPEVVQDNSATNLPIRYGVVDIVDNDVIRSITDLKFHVRGKYPKTFDSGVDVSEVESINNTTFINHVAADFMDYDATAFDGAGGFVTTSTSSHMQSEGSYTASANLMYGVTVEVPAVMDSTLSLVGVGASGFAHSRSYAYINASNGKMFYSNNSGDNDQEISATDWRGERISVIFNHVDLDTLQVYINDGSTPVISFNPHDSYASRTYLWIAGRGGSGEGCTDAEYAEWWLKEGAHNASNDPTIPEIMNAMRGYSYASIPQEIFEDFTPIAYLHPDAGLKTYSSGSNVSEITSTYGDMPSFTAASGKEPTYSAGKLTFGSTDRLDYSADYTALIGQTIGMVYKVPSSVATKSAIVSFADGSKNTNANTRLIQDDSNTVFWENQENGTAKQFHNDNDDDRKVVMFIQFESETSASYFIADPDSAFDTFNPNDLFSSAVRMVIGASDDLPSGIDELYEFVHVEGLFTAYERNVLNDYWTDKYGIV